MMPKMIGSRSLSHTRAGTTVVAPQTITSSA